MKNKIILTLIAGVALLATVCQAADTYNVSGTPAVGATASSKTNAIQNWPSAIGTNATINAIDVTNVSTLSRVGSGKDISLEFTANFAGGTGASGSTSNVIVRLAFDDKSSPQSQTTTNGTASSTYPLLWSWVIPVTTATGVGSVDVLTNFNSAVAPPAPPTTSANWYVYDINWQCVTNGSPFMTNYSIYYNAK
jgi:hypothetical protein